LGVTYVVVADSASEMGRKMVVGIAATELGEGRPLYKNNTTAIIGRTMKPSEHVAEDSRPGRVIISLA